MTSLKKRIELIEKREMLAALKECAWVQARATRRLGITERMIAYKIRKYEIKMKEVSYGEADVSSTDGKNRSMNQ
ncbi:MAG: hypothetical protein JSV11_10125 [Nitrospiraceae bacterium]|nr:MAG: hypothetical protein JSV11_10125 [Nitrospiraceae bacterium]